MRFSALAFYLISSSFVCLYMLAKEADNKAVESYLAKYDGANLYNSPITNEDEFFEFDLNL